jgi:hypothetical protein
MPTAGGLFARAHVERLRDSARHCGGGRFRKRLLLHPGIERQPYSKRCAARASHHVSDAGDVDKRPRNMALLHADEPRVYVNTGLGAPHYYDFISTRMPWTVRLDAFNTRPRGCGAISATRHPCPFHFASACITSRLGGSCVPSGAKS